MDWLELALMLFVIGQVVGIALAILAIIVGIIYVVVQTLRGH